MIGKVGGGAFERCVIVMGLSGKVTMVMMTLSAFLHRKAPRFSTGEFCRFSAIKRLKLLSYV